jgi:hypothetical protein
MKPLRMDSSVGAAPARKSLAITAFGWLIMAAAAILSVVSVVSLLMILARSHGTQSTDIGGFLLIVVAPPMTFLAGIGVVVRWRWAWVYCVVGLSLVLGWQALELTRPPKPAVTTTVSPSGVRTTTYHEAPRSNLPLIALCLGLLLVALTPRVRREFALVASGPVRPDGRLRPRPQPTAAGAAQPTAALGENAEQHLGEAGSLGPWTARELVRALLLLAMILGIAGFMAWLAFRGVEIGSTTLPAYKGGGRTVVLRAQEPMLFWSVSGFYAAVGLGAAAFGAWLMWHLLRPHRR